jgi:hypothetical protein
MHESLVPSSQMFILTYIDIGLKKLLQVLIELFLKKFDLEEKVIIFLKIFEIL